MNSSSISVPNKGYNHICGKAIANLIGYDLLRFKLLSNFVLIETEKFIQYCLWHSIKFIFFPFANFIIKNVSGFLYALQSKFSKV